MSLVTPDFGLLVWMTVIFAIVFFILAKFGFPIITNMVEKRSDYIGKSLESAREAERKLQHLAEEQQALIDDTRHEQSRILRDAASARDEMIAAARDQAKAEADALIADARRQIADEKESALRDVRRQVADLSVAVAEKVLRRELDSQEAQRTLAETYIDEAKHNG